LGVETEEKEKTMKRKFANLSRKQQERVEFEYHRLKPEDFDETMSAATRHSPNAIRLPSRLVAKLKTVAELKGKSEYQTIVRAWIEERLQQETKPAR
jgi:ribosomal protein L29